MFVALSSASVMIAPKFWLMRQAHVAAAQKRKNPPQPVPPPPAAAAQQPTSTQPHLRRVTAQPQPSEGATAQNIPKPLRDPLLSLGGAQATITATTSPTSAEAVARERSTSASSVSSDSSLTSGSVQPNSSGRPLYDPEQPPALSRFRQVRKPIALEDGSTPALVAAICMVTCFLGCSLVWFCFAVVSHHPSFCVL
jgi:hypothetical protein